MTSPPGHVPFAARRLLTERFAADIDPLSLASDPRTSGALALTVRGWWVVLAEPVAAVTSISDLADVAERSGWRASTGPEEGEPPFLGGAAGYLADDAATAMLDLALDDRPEVTPLPPVWFGVYDTAVCIPPGGEPAWLVAAELPGLSRRPARERLAELRAWAGEAGQSGPSPSRWPAPALPAGKPRWSLPATRHAEAVRTAKEWIAAGDLYQLNLTVQCTMDWPAPGAALARRLWAESPGAEHAAYLRLPGGGEIISVSPETFLRTDGDRIVTRPIKGTRPRGGDPDGDVGHARALQCSDKDRAEHVMIVDLERNDLGRVCEAGTVTVDELLALESHPTVWHLTSTVCGRLREDASFHDVLAAIFPSGSVTGAPKRMAIRRIRSLEPVRRGVYCGAIGIVSRGLTDFSVGIRTAVVAGPVASYGTGGGIVADSDADAEWAEARDKAAAFLRATGAAGYS